MGDATVQVSFHWYVEPSPWHYLNRVGHCARCGKPKDDPIHRPRWRL